MNRTTPIEKSLEVGVPVSWSNDQKGNFLENIAKELFRRQSYEVQQRVRFTGMEIDLIGRHKPSGDTVYAECKFLNSSVSANVIDLMVGKAFRRKINRLALFSAGNLSKEAMGAIDEIRDDSTVSFSFYGPDQLLEALVDSGVAPRLQEDELPPAISHATLFVYPDTPYLWLLQEQKDGRPHKLIPYAPRTTYKLPPDEIRNILDELEVLEGLPLGEYIDGSEADSANNTQAASITNEQIEVVGRVVTADTILDYRPCRPKDFVGRQGIQKEIWNYLDDVKDHITNTRLIALVGASGYGKSSLVSKLAERFLNIKWKNKFFLFPVDVRSARGPQFVSQALLEGVKTAQDAGFIDIKQELAVTDADNILASQSINKVLQKLEDENKVLVLFFDQFEEVFTKDELLPVFRVFKRFALDVHSRQSNLVVGFSWRTGISFSDSNPAYQLWNELRDHRVTKTLGLFDRAESSGLIAQFERDLGVKLLPPLRRRLQEQSQGLPWFLKKLCIHVHGQILKGVSQSDLLGSRLNVQSLFDEDLEPLTEAQLSCIKFIASNSPADSLDVYEHYGQEIVNSLLDKRLVIRTGQKLAVYWDIFRDYLTEGKVPAIPWTYIPGCTLRMALPICDVLALQGAMTVTDLAKDLGYSEGTVVNIITDLQNLAICGKEGSKHILLDGLKLNDIPHKVRAQFAEHVLYQQLLDVGSEHIALPREKVLDLVRTLYSTADVKQSTRDQYLVRLMPWFEYGGLVKVNGIDLFVYPPNKRSDKFGICTDMKMRNQEAVFVGASTPEHSFALYRKLFINVMLTRKEVAPRKDRNAAMDLTALGLARWTNKGLIMVTQANSVPEEIFVEAVNKNRVYAKLLEIVINNHHVTSRVEIGKLLGEALSKNWKPSSAQRYANGLFRYMTFVSNIGQTPFSSTQRELF